MAAAEEYVYADGEENLDLPTAKVKRIMALEGECMTVSPEATFLVARAADMFLDALAARSGMAMGLHGSEVDYKDVANAVNQWPAAKELLSDVVPNTVKVSALRTDPRFQPGAPKNPYLFIKPQQQPQQQHGMEVDAQLAQQQGRPPKQPAQRRPQQPAPQQQQQQAMMQMQQQQPPQQQQVPMQHAAAAPQQAAAAAAAAQQQQQAAMQQQLMQQQLMQQQLQQYQQQMFYNQMLQQQLLLQQQQGGVGAQQAAMAAAASGAFGGFNPQAVLSQMGAMGQAGGAGAAGQGAGDGTGMVPMGGAGGS